MAPPVKQRTLFQTWKKAQQIKAPKQECNPTIIELSSDDIDDDDLLSATVAIENQTEPSNSVNIQGFDAFAGKLWIYPTNYPIRNYQYSIVHKALFENTLVALPTGLGKTFIAAVVIYNYYRWFPQGKIVFMAPTKPLVAQQIDACYNIMGIPMEDQAQITGSTMASNRREELWKSKRIFFLTPQVINNDLTKGVCPANEIKCLVIDEAHKALGNHSYCQVVQQLLAYTRDFRVLALSATPGNDLKSVQQVLTNLLISHVEVRGEDSLDIQQYTHSRKVEKVVVKLDEQILSIKEKYFSVIQVFINNLVSNKALYNKDVSFLSKYALLMSRDQFRKDPPSGLSKYAVGLVEGDFAISISLYHGLELLLQHGMKSFFIFLKGIVEGSKGNLRSKTILQTNSTFVSIYNELTEMYGSSPSSVVLLTQAGQSQHPAKQQGDRSSYVYGHPKMRKLEEVVLKHFESFREESKSGSETRVMIFCQYRDTVREITELLQSHRPLIRPMQFVGHAPSTNPVDNHSPGCKTNRRFTQKDQLMVVEKFRNGGYNTLVSTCVGEEGLDIGDVDLIVCFDSHKSPIRLVQRMGRTGRKRAGKIVMLITEGKEERDYNTSVASRKSIHKAIMGAGKTLRFYPHNPRMIPPGINPTCHKMFITVAKKNIVEKKVKVKKKTNTGVADVSVMLKQVAEKVNEKSFLSESQQELWHKKCSANSGKRVTIKKLPKFGKMLCLDKELVQIEESQNNVSLSEWLPWQQRLQQTKFVGHSSRSQLLTEALNFCENIKRKKIDEDGVKNSISDATHTDPEIVPYPINPPEPLADLNQIKIEPTTTVHDLNVQEKEVPENAKVYSISDNLSAIFPTPLGGKRHGKSANNNNPQLKIPTPPLMDSLVFDFLDDFTDQPKPKKRSCFQIWDSDKQSVNHKLEVLGNDKPQLDCTVSLSIDCETEVCEQNSKGGNSAKTVDSTSFIDNQQEMQANESAHNLSPVLHSLHDDATNADTKDNNLHKPSHGVKERSHIKSNTLHSFNMSADMFNPQFDLKFDLDCDSISSCKKSERNLEYKQNSVQPEKNLSNVSSGNDHPTEAPKSQANNLFTEEVPDAMKAPFINISQYQRKKNQELFADLSVVGDHTLPVAKVRPQQKGSPCKTTSDEGSPLLDETKSSLKRQRRIAAPESGDENAEDDFVSLRKRKCFGLSNRSNEASTSCEVTPIHKQRNKRMRVLSSDCDSLSDSASPVFTGKSKSIRNSLDKIRQAVSCSPATGHSVRKHSTPKVDLFRCKDDYAKRIHQTKATLKPDAGKNKLHGFLDDEADVSGEMWSSDESSDHEFDEDMMKFVNDASQLTQNLQHNESAPDEQAMYLKSVKSPYGNKGKYKLAYGKGNNIDVFSQTVEEDQSDYAEDSFVVNNNETEISKDLGEITILSHKHSSDDEEFFLYRPKTRGEVKLKKAIMSRKTMKESKKKPLNKKKGRRILVCEDDSDENDEDQPFKDEMETKAVVGRSWNCATCTLLNDASRKTCKACGKYNSTEATNGSTDRFCEICGGILISKGWLCKSCLALLKASEEGCDANKLSVISPLLDVTSTKVVAPSTSRPLGDDLHLESARAERLLKSKRKQQELRKKHKDKISSSHQKSFLDGDKFESILVKDTQHASPSHRLSPIKMPTLDLSTSATHTTVPFTSYTENSKLVVMIDSREASSVGRLVQLLRTKHGVKVEVTSLQTCDILVSCRSAVFRKTSGDFSTPACRNKLASAINHAKHLYSKLYLLVEKDRPKTNKLGSNTSTTQLGNYVANIVAVSQGVVKVLFSENQDESAHIIWTLANREEDCGKKINPAILNSLSNTTSKTLFNICSALPGVSHLSALYLCHNYKSMHHICSSSVDDLVDKGCLSFENAENLKLFCVKKFDIQMVPD